MLCVLTSVLFCENIFLLERLLLSNSVRALKLVELTIGFGPMPSLKQSAERRVFCWNFLSLSNIFRMKMVV